MREEPADGRLAPVTYLPSARRPPSSEPVASLPRREAGERKTSTQGEEAARGERVERRAANVAVHQLARRGMSRWELAQVLERRGVDEATAAAELDRLESLGLLDDAALAVSLVFTQHTRKGLGRSAIAHELRQRHIDPAIIDEALGELGDDDERERAIELAVKRAAQLHRVDETTARRRLSGFLARKGYDTGVIRDAVETALGDRSGVRFR